MKDIARNFRSFGTMTVSGVVLKCYGIWTNTDVIEAEEFRRLEAFIADPGSNFPMLEAALNRYRNEHVIPVDNGLLKPV